MSLKWRTGHLVLLCFRSFSFGAPSFISAFTLGKRLLFLSPEHHLQEVSIEHVLQFLPFSQFALQQTICLALTVILAGTVVASDFRASYVAVHEGGGNTVQKFH